jgi:hypothetical protein
MKGTAALAFSLLLAGGILVAQEATVRSLLSKDLSAAPGWNTGHVVTGTDLV